MIEQLSSPITRHLDECQIHYEWMEIPLDPDKKPVRSLEDMLLSIGQDPGRIVRSLLFRTGSGDFVLLAVAGGGRADWGVLRKQLNERRLTMAEADEVLAATGFPIGAVPPIALPENVRVLIDEGLFTYERVVIGSGILGQALDINSTDLRRGLSNAAVIGRFIKTE